MIKILYVTIAWPQNKTSNLYTDLIYQLVNSGASCCVLNGSAFHDSNEILDKIISQSIRLVTFRTMPVAKTSPLKKMLALIILNRQFKKAFKSSLKNEQFDLILFNTPPITLYPFLKYLKITLNAKLYLLLKDIWPYGFVDLGVISKYGPLWFYFKHCEKSIYNLSDRIGCMSPLGVEFINKVYSRLYSDKLEVCPNSIENRTDSSTVEYTDYSQIKVKFGIPEDSTVFLFSGNLGKGHGLDFLVKVISNLGEYSKAFFLIGGSGTHFDYVKNELGKLKTHRNFFLYSYLPEDEFNLILKISDVGLILLDSVYSYPQFPSRLLAYLSNKMAVLCAVNANTDIGKIVESSLCGYSSIHGDLELFTKYIRILSENTSRVKEFGQNSFRLFLDKYTADISAKIIINSYLDILSSENGKTRNNLI